MPTFFQFLSVMAFNVFLKEKVCISACTSVTWLKGMLVSLFHVVAGGCGSCGGGNGRNI